MVKVSYEVNGRKVSAKGFSNAIVKAMMDKAAEHVRKKLANCTCPTHGEQPSVTIVSTDNSAITYKISGCCEELTKLGKAQFA